jgi:hypothetical protein
MFNATLFLEVHSQRARLDFSILVRSKSLLAFFDPDLDFVAENIRL